MTKPHDWFLTLLIVSKSLKSRYPRWFLGDEEPLECKLFDETNSGAWCVNGESLELCDSDPLKTNEKKYLSMSQYGSSTHVGLNIHIQIVVTNYTSSAKPMDPLTNLQRAY